MVFSFFAAMNPLSLRIDKKLQFIKYFCSRTIGLKASRDWITPPHLVKLGDIEWIEWYPRI